MAQRLLWLAGMTDVKPLSIRARGNRFKTGQRARERAGWPCLIIALSIVGCSDGESTAGSDERVDEGNGGSGNGGSAHVIPDGPFTADASFFTANTVSQRVALPLTPPGALLRAEALANQLAGYDPGSLLRCQLSEQAAYDAAIDTLGGVRWGYSVAALEDLSKPRFLAGFQNYSRDLYPSTAGNAGDAAPAPVEIALPDIVAVTESAALFYSTAHGLLLVNLTEAEPRFECATPLPGRVDQFYFHQAELVAMIQANGGQSSFLLHFAVNGTALRFIETVDLGPVSILDSRRFNDDLVFYTDLRFNTPPAPGQAPVNNGLPNLDAPQPPTLIAQPQHRALRVFRVGEALVERMHDTLLDTTPPAEQLAMESVTPDTALDTLINESRRFGRGMWASDRYFVVTEEISKTYLSAWREYSYPICTRSHTLESPYTHCWTEYETRPNPDYVPPDNSGGDRGCQGATLADCLTTVARVSNQTIQVPVGQRCEERVRHTWVCDAREQRTVQYPEFRAEHATHLFIYEYTPSGFVRVDSSVHEIITPGLDAESLDAQVATLTTSTETFELSVPGQIQTLHFQNGFLYVISEGVLQVYAMGGSSIVRTATLPVVNESLQSTLFSGSRLYLSDFGWNGEDRSSLRVVNLDNPAFPTVEASTHSLPGGHRSIIASDHGIFTIGSVAQFQGQAINAIKLGLFSDPFVEERAYLILGTDLEGTWLAPEEAQFFDGAGQRALVPYSGFDAAEHSQFRVGVSHVEADQIVSEGAVVVPELPQRVRPIGGATESYLSFSTNSIEWLAPNAAAPAEEWQTTPVLEYFQPTSVYRLNDANDYVEVQRLGDRCKLFFANASNINQRDSGNYSEAFDCFRAGVSAYDNLLLFTDTGLEFDADSRSVRMLDEGEMAETRTRIAERPYCLLSLELVDDTRVDYDAMPENAEVTCMSPAEYQERLNVLINDRRAL